MAAIGVMTMDRVQADPVPGGNTAMNVLAWVVLIPSIAARAWEIVIRDTAAEAGIPVVVYNDGNESFEPSTSPCIVLTVDATLVERFGGAHGVVVAVELGDWVSCFGDAALAQGLATTSASLEQASRHEARWVTDRDVNHKGDVQLWPGFTIRSPGPQGGGTPARHASAIDAALAFFGANGTLSSRWDQALFLYDERRLARRPSGYELDTMGPARTLVFGPYIVLPKGMWKATIRFSFDPHAASHEFRAEWGTTTAYVSETFTPGYPGVFELVLDYEWLQAEQAEMRIILTQGSLGGRFHFLGMEVEKT